LLVTVTHSEPSYIAPPLESPLVGEDVVVVIHDINLASRQTENRYVEMIIRRNAGTAHATAQIHAGPSDRMKQGVPPLERPPPQFHL